MSPVLTKNRLIGGAITLSLLTLIAACGSPASPAAGSSDKYVIGEIDDLTGGLSFVDLPWHNGIVAAVKAQNAAGGINGHQIDLITRDAQGSATVAVSAYRQMQSQSHVIAILGLGDSTVDDALFPLATKDGIPLIAVGPSAKEISQPNSIMYEYGPSAAEEARAQVQYAQQLKAEGKISGPVRIATVAYVGPQGADFAAAVRTAAKDAGFDYSTDLTVKPSASNFGTEAAKVAADHANIVMTEVAGSSTTTLMNSLSAVGVPLTTPIVGYSWSIASSLPWDNFAVVTDYRVLGDQPGVTKYRSAMTAAGFNPTGPFMVESYAAAQLTFDALKRCGFPCTSSQLVGQLNNTNTTLDDLAFGPIVWSPTFHTGPTTLAVAPYDKTGQPISYGKPITLYPAPK